MKSWKYIVVGCLTLGALRAQQQTVYTNYLLNPYLYNSAYAGSVEGTQLGIGYRNQWVGFDGAPKTYLAYGYGNLKKRPKMALGGMVMTERIGLLQRTSFYGTYTYILKINKKATINFGLGLGGIQHKVRVYDAKPYDKDDNFMGSDVLNAFAIDANAGFYLYTKNFFLSFSDQQMPNSKIRWDNSNGKNTNHFYASTGYNFALDAKRTWIIQPSMLARTNSPAPYQLEFMAKVLYQEMVWLGLSYRQNSSASFLVGCKIKNELVVGYAYDLTLTKLSNYSSGSHELLLSYLIPFKKKKSKSELIKDADEEELNKIDNSVKTNLRSKKKKEKEAEQEKQPEPSKENEIKTPETAPVEQPEQNNTQGTEVPSPGSTQTQNPETTTPPAENSSPAQEVPATPATSPAQEMPSAPTENPVPENLNKTETTTPTEPIITNPTEPKNQL